MVVGESLVNGCWRIGTLANLWRMVFGELTRWRIFGEWFLANLHVGESLANLCGMGFGELTRWRIFDDSLGNGFWLTDTLANLSERFLAN